MTCVLSTKMKKVNALSVNVGCETENQYKGKLPLFALIDYM